MSKQSALQFAQENSKAHIGPLLTADINLAAGTGNTNLIVCAAGERFYVEAITLQPEAAGTFALLSAAVRKATVRTANAGQLYVFCDIGASVDADELVLNRTDSIGMGGSISYRILT